MHKAIAWLAGELFRIRRAHVEDAMARAGIARSYAPRMYEALARGLVELIRFLLAGRRGRARLVDRVTIDADAVTTLEEGLARGPVVLFASHTGNWELAAAAAAKLLDRHGRRLFVVAKPMHSRIADRIVRRLRAALGVALIAPHGALRAAARALENGDVVVMPIDQVPDRASHGVLLPFLGQSVLVDRAPATLAHRAKATVLVVGASRSGTAQRIHLLDTMAPGEATIEETLVRATASLDAFVRRAPEGWLWLHRRARLPLPLPLVLPAHTHYVHVPWMMRSRSRAPDTPAA